MLAQNQKLSGTELIEALEWRYATKVFDASRKIRSETWAVLEKALTLSPSSYGIQPWKFILVENRAVREKLMPFSWNQRQVVDASHFVVIAAKREISSSDVDNYIARISQVRGIPAETLKSYRDMMIGDLVQGPPAAVITHWAARQCYIALGTLLTSAAILGIDGCPMEGFKSNRYDEVLGLGQKGLTAVVLCALGYRSASDKYASLPKVLYEARELIERV